VNFGVFQLYGDNALSDSLDTVLQLSLSIPVQELMAYPKVGSIMFLLRSLVHGVFCVHTFQHCRSLSPLR
jgi:hypothetical protein